MATEVENRAAGIIVRPMESGEEDAVRSLMERSFSAVARWFFVFTPHVLVAELDGELVGAAVLRLITLPDGKKAGFFYRLFTPPEHRNLGIGGMLSDRVLEYFKEQRCDDVVMSIETFNSSSFRFFSTRPDYSLFSPGQQLRRFGWKLPLFWVQLAHHMKYACFLWISPRSEGKDSPVMQWWGSLLANSLLAMLAFLWLNWFVDVPMAHALPVAAGCAMTLVCRHAAMKAAGNRLGLATRFRAWEGTFCMGVMVALLAGRFFPSLGSIYPASTDFSFKKLKAAYASIGTAGAFGQLAPVAVAWLLVTVRADLGVATALVGGLLWAGKHLLLFDVAAAFFPFSSTNGWLMRRARPRLWAVLAAISVVICFGSPPGLAW